MALALLGLAACVAKTPTPQQSYRNTGTEIYSNAVFEPQRIIGRWAQVAAFSAAETSCKPGGAEFAQGTQGLQLTTRLCLSGQETRFSGPVEFVAPGRMALRGADPAGIGQIWYVIWVDVGYRTMVIGTPSGDFAFVLNRDGPLPADRLKAAKEILDWNGYDLSRLQVFKG